MNRSISLASLALIAVLLLNACSSTPKHARYIPKDASVVIGLNTAALSKKMAWSAITSGKLWASMKEKAPDSKGKEAIEDIGNAGIDWASTLYFYARPDTRFDNKAKMSAIVPLDDAEKWTAFVKKTFPKAAITKVKDRNEAMLDDKMYAAWTNDLLIVNNAMVRSQETPQAVDTTVVATSEAVAMPDTVAMTYTAPAQTITEPDVAGTVAEMEASFNLSKENSIIDNHRFKKLENDGHDVSVFVAYDAIMDNATMRNEMGSMSMMLNNALWKNAAMATGIDFVDGKITADILYYPSDSMHSVAKEMGKEEVDADILGRLPSQNLNMAMGYHLSPEGLKMILDKMNMTGLANLALMQKGLNVDDILGAFTGDMAFSLNDFKLEKKAPMADSSMSDMMDNSSMNRPQMNLVYAIKIKDKAKLDKLLGLLNTEMGLVPVAPNTYAFPMGNDSVVTLINDKYIVVSNKMMTAQNFLQAKSNTPEIVKQEVSGHPIGLAMDLKSFAANVSTEGMTDNPQGMAMINELRNLFASASMNGGEFKRDASNYHMELNFVNQHENSLMQLLNLAERVSAAEKKGAVVLR